MGSPVKGSDSLPRELKERLREIGVYPPTEKKITKKQFMEAIGAYLEWSTGYLQRARKRIEKKLPTSREGQDDL